MNCIEKNKIIDSILNSYKGDLGNNFEQYRNHVYRVFNFAIPFVLSNQDIEKLSIASSFHDLGIWTNKTFDYINPSIELLRKYSFENKLDKTTVIEIEIIIREHHKLTKEKTSQLAEIFRQSDLVDLTLGLIKLGRDRKQIELIRNTFPNKGFHLYLLRLFLKNLITNPLKPLPMFKL